MKIPDITKFSRFVKRKEDKKVYDIAFCEDKEFCQGIQELAKTYQVSNPCSLCTQLVIEKLFRFEEAQEESLKELPHDTYLS